MTKKLFKVTCRGMKHTHGTAYVVADDAAVAYSLVRQDLDAHSLGFAREREMESVELLAEVAAYPDCERRLYL